MLTRLLTRLCKIKARQVWTDTNYLQFDPIQSRSYRQ